MRTRLAALVAVLLVASLVTAGLELRAAPASVPSIRNAASAGATAAVRSTGLPAPAADAAGTSASEEGRAAGAASRLGAPSTPAAPFVARRTFPTASPAQFHVERERPVVDPALAAQLQAAAPSDRLVVLVHAADAPTARRLASARGLTVATSFPKVGVVAAVGTPASIRGLAATPGPSYLEADVPLAYTSDTSHAATRGDEARAGFSVSYDEIQPDLPGEKRTVCSSKRNRRGKIVRDRRGRPVRVCRTESTPPRPQPPIRRTLTSSGVDGRGVGIAIVDSGVDGTHPMFQSAGRSKVVQNLKFTGFAQCLLVATEELCAGEEGQADERLFVPVPDGDTPSLGGHGTHVAGIAAGYDVRTADGHALRGAAPGAELTSLSVGATIGVVGANAALNWILEHHEDPCLGQGCAPIKVVNNSYGPEGGGDFDVEDLTSKLQRALVTEGVVMVWANGNDAGDGSTNVSNPSGQDPTPGILAVANYSDNDVANRDNLLASSSSRGEQGRPETYPDLSAPGSQILSACRTQLAICRGASVADPNYGSIGGTSMAAPHIAGIVAQLFQANPSLSPADVEDALEDTARRFAAGGSYEPDVTNDGFTSFDKGHGLVDAVGAVARVRGFHLFPDAADACAADGPVAVDPAGDAFDVVVTPPVRPASVPALDVREVRAGWTEDGVTTLTIRVQDLPASPTLAGGSDGENFRTEATLRGAPVLVNASRGAQGARFTIAGATSTTVSGTFDAAGDTVTVTIPPGSWKTAGLPTPEAGDVLVGLATLGRRSAGALAPPADAAPARCPFTFGAGAVPPPVGTTTGPDAPAKPPYSPPEAKGSVTAGGPAYTWQAGPMTALNPTGACGATNCDRRGLSVDVPGGGAILEVVVTPSNALADFDLAVFGPDGKQVATSAGAPVLDSATSTEKVSVKVTTSGVYRIDVVAYATANHTFKGEARLV